MNNKFKAQIANYAGVYTSMNTPNRVISKENEAASKAKKELAENAVIAWRKYSQSSKGKAELVAMETMDLPTRQDAIAKLMDNPAFQEIKDKIDSLDLPIKSFSIGLNFEAEFIIGITGTIGVAIGIGESKNLASSKFLCLGVSEGVDEGGMTGVQFGFWTSSPADIGGYSWSTEVDLGLGAEVSGAISYTLTGGIGGFTVEVGVGEEDGIMEVESYTFILGSQENTGFLRLAYQKPKNNLLIITKVKCINPSNDMGKNEVYFKFKADNEGDDYYYPTYDYFSMEKGDTWNCGRSVWFNNSISVKVYDEDGLSDDKSDDDENGDFTINLNNLNIGEEKSFDSIKDYSSFGDTITYKIYAKLVAVNAER